MRKSRFIPLTIAMLFLTCRWAAAEDPAARPMRTLAAAPLRVPVMTPPRLLPTWAFVDIRVSVVSPNSVKIDWAPLAGADAYCVYRNGIPIGPPPQPTCPTATQAGTAYDYYAPANSTLTYYVTAAQATTVTISQAVIPGTNRVSPNPQIHKVTEERIMPGGTSNTVTVVTPMLPPPRWVLRPDAVPSIAPNSAVLLFVHGMDSRAEEADDITKALFMALTATAPTPPPPILPPIAANLVTLQFNNCPNAAGGCPETCDHMDNFANGQQTGITPFDVVNGTPTTTYFAPLTPLQLLDTAPPAGTQINVPAAHNIGANEGRLRPELRAAAAAAQPAESLRLAALRFAAGDLVWGNAFADLSVTGHRAFASFRQALPGETFCQSIVVQPLTPAANDVVNGCRMALDRAYRVANFLRTGERGDTPALKAAKAAERTALGWIAVSGEDDSPHRPVNVPSSDAPQFDLQVNVEAPMARGPAKSVNVRTRYTIAQSQIPGRNLVVISVDLPTSGYADNLDYNAVSPLSAIGVPKSTLGIPDFAATGATPLLDFIEAFVVRFAETLDQSVPFKNNIRAVMGGSLGGNMTFRLGRRPNVPWMPEFVVWSPASIWSSLGGGSDLTKHQGPLKAWQNADAALSAPGVGDRAAFFGSWDQAIVPVIIPMAQSDTWTSKYYLCKYSSIAGARLDRQETYDPLFLAWHWRLGGEQLLFSHQNIDPATNQPLYMSNHKPMLLACGVEDHVPYNDICPATQSTAQHMLTPGKALILGQTGHSLDNERRNFWAQQIIGFLGL